MSLAARSTTKPPNASSHRLSSIATAKATPMERLATLLTDVFEQMFEQKAADVAEATIQQLEKKGWRAPVPSQAYIAESHLREALGTRAGSPMAPATFAKEFAGKFVRVPASTTGNAKTRYVYFADVKKHLPHIADQLEHLIIQPQYHRK